MPTLGITSHWKRCDRCGEKIPSHATVCRQCRNFQGWRWWVRLIALSLPWLTVLTSGAALYIQQYNQEVVNRYATLNVSFTPVQFNTATIIVGSSANKPIVLVAATLLCYSDAGGFPESKFHSTSPSFQRVLQPNAELSFDVQFSNEEIQRFMNFASQKVETAHCQVRVDGKINSRAVDGIADIEAEEIKVLAGK